MEDRPVEVTTTIPVPTIIKERTLSFADEWGAREIVLSPTEETTVRHAASVLGVAMGYTPTGRYVEACLRQAMNLALMHHKQATTNYEKSHWWTVFVRARRALGKQLN